MQDLYTKSGRLLQLVEDHLYARSGRYLGCVGGRKVFDLEGRYAGSIVGDRVVYRTIDSAAVGAASRLTACEATTRANAKGSAVWGIEPPFMD